MTIVGLLTIYLASTDALEWNWREIWVAFAFMGIVLSISLWFSLINVRGDQLLFPLTVALSSIGLLVIMRLEPVLKDLGGGKEFLAERQLTFLAIGLGFFATIVTVMRGTGWLRRYKYTWALTAIALMIVTMLIGTEVNGARLWLDLGFITIQPSEIAKVALVVFFAGYLAENQELIVSSYRYGPFRLPPIPYLMPLVVMWMFSLLIVVAQNDLGAALLFFGVFLAMLYMASGKLSYVVAGLLAFAAGVWIAYQLFDRVAERVSYWLNPWNDPLAGGYQQVQSEYALASGKLLGSGLAYGHPEYIPEVHSDFVYSSIGEELGLLGSVAILLLFLLVVYRGYYIAINSNDAFNRYLSAGLTTILALQSLIIIAGTVRLVPLTGITLPFISAGGSSLLTNFLIIGILVSISDPRSATS